MNKCTSIENDIRQFKHILPKYTDLVCRLSLFFTSWSLRTVFIGFIPLTLIFSIKCSIWQQLTVSANITIIVLFFLENITFIGDVSQLKFEDRLTGI